MSREQKEWTIYVVLLLAALTFRVGLARFLPNDDPYDGKVYAQLARNLLERHVYSHSPEPPYEPSIIRLPGYPLLLAGIYSLFGHGNNAAARVVQGVIDTASCALVALIAFQWGLEAKQRRTAAIAGLALAAACPFTAIYVAAILTETATVFLALAGCLCATLAFQAASRKRAILLWSLTGLVAGLAVLFRPDSGLFAAAIGITLLAGPFMSAERAEEKRKPWSKLSRPVYLAAIFSVTFCLALVPWTIRNRRVFHLFQPLAPAHAEMPGEFVPHGYLSWLRTWVESDRYIGPVLWSLDQQPLKLDDFPASAFDSQQEKQRVAALLEQYNNPSQSGAEAVAEGDENAPSMNPESEGDEGSSPDTTPSPDASEPEEADDESENSELGNQPTPEGEPQDVEMTPQIDAAFAQVAQERITRAPFRYYVRLPVRRALSLWFDTHSQYYPFEGELFPLKDLDTELRQQIWLPLFAGLTWLYTLLGMAGAWILWRSRGAAARRWVLLTALIILLRLGFFSTLENPEPRYVVVLFPFLSIMGGIAISYLLHAIKRFRPHIGNR